MTSDETGATLPELLIALALVVTLSGVSVAAWRGVADAARVRQAAAFLTSRLQWARQQAAFGSANTGLVFDAVDGHWTFRVCVDGNGNGLRRAELTTGVDPCLEGPDDLLALFGGTAVAVDGSIPGPDNEPGTADPVRFGRSDMASFSPSGSCTSGSVYLRSLAGVQYVVRVTGVTGRTRLLRYEPRTRSWKEI